MFIDMVEFRFKKPVFSSFNHFHGVQIHMYYYISDEILTWQPQMCSHYIIRDQLTKKNGIDLTHWSRVTHICVGKLTIIGSDNGLSPARCQAIIWTNAGILLIGPLGTNFSEILIRIQTFSFTKMHLKMLSAKWRPFCLGLNVLRKDVAPNRWQTSVDQDVP